MIITAFIEILNYILTTLVSVLPSGSGFPEEVHSSATLLGGYARTLDPLLPFDTLFTIITLVVIVEIALLTFRTFKWLLSHVPFIGGNG